jgi:prepilin-type N-terminal cleavage/methylation domain-containing protein
MNSLHSFSASPGDRFGPCGRRCGGGLSRCRGRSAFTLFEMVMVILIMGIVAAALVPPLGNNLYSSRLRTAANVLAADIDYCASECIARPSAPRVIIFDTTANCYSILDFSASSPIKHPADGLDFINDFASGRNAQLNGVHIQSVVAGATPLTSLAFDSYGRPLINADATITLAFNGQTLALQVSATTGEVSITGN